MVILDMTNQHSSAVALRIIYLLLTETAKGKHLIIVQLVEVRPDPRRFACFEGVRLSFLVSSWTNALLISYKDFGIVGFESETLKTEGMVSCEMFKISEGKRHGQEKRHASRDNHQSSNNSKTYLNNSQTI